jgi:hypothetical protein
MTAFCSVSISRKRHQSGLPWGYDTNAAIAAMNGDALARLI